MDWPSEGDAININVNCIISDPSSRALYTLRLRWVKGDWRGRTGRRSHRRPVRKRPVATESLWKDRFHVLIRGYKPNNACFWWLTRSPIREGYPARHTEQPHEVKTKKKKSLGKVEGMRNKWADWQRKVPRPCRFSPRGWRGKLGSSMFVVAMPILGALYVRPATSVRMLLAAYLPLVGKRRDVANLWSFARYGSYVEM